MSQMGVIDDDGPFLWSEENCPKYMPHLQKAPSCMIKCPFCGGIDLIIYREACLFMSEYTCIQCETCHAQGPSKGFDDEWQHDYTWNHRNGDLIQKCDIGE